MLKLISRTRKCRYGKQIIETLHSIYSLMYFIEDEYCIIIFKEPIENKAMIGHVIRSEEVHNEGSCGVLC